MKILLHILLGLAALLSTAALILHNFLFPDLSPGLILCLRILTAVLVQWLFLRLFQKKGLRAIPTFAAALAVVWGFFLFLTAPSWVGITFKSFLLDYTTFLLGCCLVWAFSWLMARITPRLKKARRTKKQKHKKQSK